MHPTQNLSIQLVDKNGHPLAVGNVLVQVDFFMNGQHRYSFKVGRTNETGLLQTSYDEIELLRKAAGHQFLMDYNSTLEQCDPIIQVVVPAEENLRQQQSEVERSLGKKPSWADPWPSNELVHASVKRVDLANGMTAVSIPTEIVGSD